MAAVPRLGRCMGNICHYSNKSRRVLEKPAKFNPPSHPSRLVNPRKQYVPPLPESERKAQKTRHYPHMMPPDGSFMHWFIHNRSIHVWITMGTLSALAFYTWLHSEHESHYGHMLPPFNTVFSHPIQYISTHIEVFRLNKLHKSALVNEERQRRIDDIAKRSEYRKAHGLDESSGAGGWLNMGKSKAAQKDEPNIAANEETTLEPTDQAVEPNPPKRKPVKKWFGIW